MTTSRAVLWDLDGTLVDSAEYHWLAWREALTAAGHTFDRDFLVATFGQRNDRILRTMLGPDATDAEIQRIADDKEARYRALVRKRGIELLPGAELWLKRLRASGWRQALATSAPRANVATMVEVLGLAEYFGAVVAAEDVQRGKPDPQVFLLAAERVGVADLSLRRRGGCGGRRRGRAQRRDALDRRGGQARRTGRQPRRFLAGRVARGWRSRRILWPDRFLRTPGCARSAWAPSTPIWAPACGSSLVELPEDVFEELLDRIDF